MASLLDPRTKKVLQKVMTETDFQRLKRDLVEFMIEQKKHQMNQSNQHAENESHRNDNNAKVKVSVSAGLFDGLEDSDEDEDIGVAPGDEVIRADCEAELERYLVEKFLKLEKNRDDNGKKVVYNDPLKWWKGYELKYQIMAPLAAIFLAITASERVFSLSALVMNVKQAHLDDDIASGIIFLKHNLPLLMQYYDEVSKGGKGALPRRFCGLPECFDIMTDEEVGHVDVGQDMFHNYSYDN